MALIPWDNSLSVGVRQIDDQHQKLVGMVNKLHDAMTTGKGGAILQGLLADLVNYTVTHFRTEEGLMTKAGYPDFASHKALHEAFIKQVMDFKKKLESGQARITIDIMNFLTDWLKKHILDLDKKVGQFLNASCAVGAGR